MTLEQVLRHYKGNKTRIAEALGISQPAVTQWWKRGYVPVLRQYQLQRLTRGRLKVEEV